MLVMTNTNIDALAVHRNTWVGQMKDALSVNGGDLANATCTDYILHLLAFNWKVIFSIIPPPTLLGGWLCFFVSLAAVGVVTAIIGDIATIFGCAVGLRNSITGNINNFFTHSRLILQSSVSISGRGLQSKTPSEEGKFVIEP